MKMRKQDGKETVQFEFDRFDYTIGERLMLGHLLENLQIAQDHAVAIYLSRIETETLRMLIVNRMMALAAATEGAP